MEPPTKRNRDHTILIIVLILVLMAGALGWMLGRSGNNSMQSNPSVSNTSPVNNTLNNSEVKSLVGYALPDGWNEDTCPSSANVVYIIPNGTSLDCNANPSAPIKIYKDPQNTNDCQQLNNIQGVKKHVCISLYINGRKSLKASTEYPKSSSYSVDTTISDYYIDTGKGVVKVEYTYTSSNDYQAGFDQLATSINIK